ncbi:MAG: EcsC family protein [Nocardioidaceae bacterium]|nr:EcsC family protein [Nocardioidaceae bacterium]
MGVGNVLGRIAGSVATDRAPGLASNFVRQAFDRAVDGAGPMRGAAEAADKRLEEHNGNVTEAIDALIDAHVRMATAQGFVTNLGGLLTVAVMIPANISGLALLQCHMVAGIAHLQGYDVTDPRVRNAVLACILGEDTVRGLVKNKKLPSTPMAIATAPSYDFELDRRIASEVAAELIGRVAGKRTVTFIARRAPIIGGGVGAVTDGFRTYQVGKFAAKELRARKRA